MREQDQVKMEFLLTLNDNIVVQRFFNVRGYNPKARVATDLYEYIFDVKETLHHYLKMKTVVYLLDNKDAIAHDPKIMDTSFTDGPENFHIYVKIGDETICHRIFDAKLYPPKVRYTVDVRPFLKDVLRDLTDIFSNNKLSYQYLDFETSK
jgi:hypothetical protein